MFPRPREICPRIDNAEITDFNSKRNNTLPARRFAARSWSLALRARWSLRTDGLPYSPGSCSSGVCMNRSLFRAISRQVPCNIAATAPPVHRSCGQSCAYSLVSRHTDVHQRTVSSLLPLVTRKGNCSRKKRSSLQPSAGHLHSTDSVCRFTTFSAFVRTFTFARHGGLLVY